ncbi:MAG: hypothetical protein QXK89_05560 [Candidatus Bathyarchaeia archaeon]
MSKKISSSTMYYLRKNIGRLINYRPPTYVIAAILMVITIFLLGGGVYDVSMPAISAVPYYRGFIFLYPRLHDQVLNESIAIMIAYALGALGLLLIYQSAKYRRNPSQASLLIRIGIMLLIMVFIVAEATLYLWKLGLGF